MSVPYYDIYLRDASYNRMERLDMWTSFTIIMRFNGVGTWELTIPTNSNLVQYINEHIGIIVQRNGTTIFSGHCGGTEESFIETKEFIQIAGVDDNVFLETPARPNPAQANAPYDREFDVITDQASTVMFSLVGRNIGPAAPSDWKIPALQLGTNPLLGSTITSRARFDPLITLLGELASTGIAGGLGFRILQSDSLSAFLVFNVYQPQDLHNNIKFSIELDNMSNFRRVHQTPGTNYFIVAGGDDFGENRTVVEGGDYAAIVKAGRRIAQFVDKRGVVDPSELNQELAEQLATVITQDIITIEPIDVPGTEFGVDYNLGDYVNVIVRGVEYPRIVREVEIEFSPDGGVITKPTLADPFGSNDDVLTQHFRSLAGRLSNLERNWNVPDNSITADMLHDTMRWEVGDIKTTARPGLQPGWLELNGADLSRTIYSRLYGAIGTLYGSASGTTFKIPDARDRVIIYNGTLHVIGTSGGSQDVSLPNHHHDHSHGLNNHTHASQAHTHEGSHSHGMRNHTHSFAHNHTTDIDHDHPAFESGLRQNEGAGALGFNEPAPSSGAFDHRHNVNVPALGTTNKSTNSQSTSTSGTPSNNTTDPDTNAPPATYTSSPSPPVPNSSEPDTTNSGATTITFVPPHVTVRAMIYTGVVS